MALSTVIGIVITVSGIPDIVVTLAASFILSGLALFVLSSPGGGFSADLQRRVVGGFSEPWPSILWIVGALLLVWLPLKRSRTGIAMFAVGSDRNAAFLSGVRVGTVRVLAYTVGGLLAGTAGIVTTAFTGSGEPRASIGANATLNSVAAVVLGGVALSGGVGGLVGPVLAAMCLTLIPAIMLGLGWDPSYAGDGAGHPHHPRGHGGRSGASEAEGIVTAALATTASRRDWRHVLAERPIIVLSGVLVVLYVITGLQDDSLFTVRGVRSILLLACPLAIFAASQTLCMLTAGIDLSIAMTANFAAYVAANQSGRGTVAALALSLLVGRWCRAWSTAWASACSRSTR